MRAFVKSGLAVMAVAFFAVSSASDAENLPAPQGPVILTVSGHIANTTDGETAKFDRSLLEGLGVTRITTDTPWYDEAVTFEGVLARRLLDYVGADGKTVVATALNQYSAEIPLSDFQDKGVLLALKVNGEYLAIRDKGPIFIIYPFNQNETLRNETYFARSVWQVKDLKIK